MKGLKGINTVIGNLNKEFIKIKSKSVAGLIEASIVIRRDMDQRPPLIPVNLGNLRSSWFTVTATSTPVKGGNFKGKNKGELAANHGKVAGEAKTKTKLAGRPLLIMGFTANYAQKVHEYEARSPNRPGSGPYFFSSALERNEATLLAILKGTMKL